MTRRRLLIVHDTLAGWGAEKNLSHFGEFVDQDQFEVSYLLTGAGALSPGRGARAPRVFLLGAPRIRSNSYTQPINFLLKFVCAVTWLLRRRGRFDYLIASNPEECVISFLAGRTLRPGNRVLVYNQTPVEFAPANLFSNLALRAFIAVNKRADGVLCLSRGLCDHLAGTHSVKTRMFILPSCIDPLRIDAQSREQIDEQWLLRDQRKTLIFVGRLSNRQKRVDVLLDAVALLRRTGGAVPFKVILVGDGEDRDFLECRAKALGLQDQVYFLGYKANPYKYYALSDLFVLTSDVEGFGNVIIEAMACGLPVISTDCVAGPAEILEGGRWGVLVPPGNPEAVAGKISQVLADADLRRELGAKSRARAKAFEGSKVFQGFTRICEEIESTGVAI